MKTWRVLVVEDNAITRKFLRVALQAEGYEVVEAADGAAAVEAAAGAVPDLVLQDLVLPDCDGFELHARLRALPGLDAVPILAISGLAQLEEARVLAAGFSDFLLKPVEPSRLVEVVRGHLITPAAVAGGERSLRVLVVDDDPAQRKLTQVRLARLGFRVTTAADGAEALQLARRSPPDVVVSDVFMPRLDGFAFCLALRKDPSLARIPVVLASSTYLDESDRVLAEKVGANRFVVRTPDLAELIAAVRAAADEEPPPARLLDAEAGGELGSGLVRRLEHQATMTVSLAQRCALQAAELAVLGGIAEALAHAQDPGEALQEILARCLDAGGVSLGAVYLMGTRGPYLEVQAGFRAESDTSAPGAASFFGQTELLRDVIHGGAAVVVPSAVVAPETGRGLLDAAGAESLLVAPILWRGERLGALVMASRGADLTRDEHQTFARAVAAQLGQSLALTQAFSRIAESESLLRTILDSEPECVKLIERDGRVRMMNAAGLRMLELDPTADVVGASVYPFISPDHRRAFAERLERTFAGETGMQEFEVIGQRGGHRQVEAHSAPLRDQEGAIVAQLAVARDVTERRQLELQLRHAQKMEALGRLSGGIAHDFNNLLAVIVGYSELALARLPDDDLNREALAEVLRAAQRAGELTRQLLAFSRRQPARPRILDLNQVVGDAEKMLRRLIGEEVRLLTELPPEPAVVRADPGQIEQVLVNLAVNARDAMPEGGELTVRVRDVEIGSASAAAHPDLPPGPYVRLEVSDTGAGMDEATRARIFEPFFTTKETGKGTGLGLATVYGIVRQSAGDITVASAPGEGTTFTILLPRSPAP
jgi:PAS domain S-box-containing protein